LLQPADGIGVPGVSGLGGVLALPGIHRREKTGQRIVEELRTGM
jgi:hypothetical protein